MPKSLKVLVTGGAGFIGSHLVDRLVHDCYAVRVLDDLSTGKLENIASHLDTGRIEFVKGNICDTALVKKSVEGVDLVFHLAAVTSVPFSVANPALTFDVNLGGTLNLLQSSANERVNRFIFVSSCAVYGDPQSLPVSELAAPDPISPYAESKLTGERYCLGFDDRRLLPSAVLRFFNVYGPRQGLNDYSGVITRFISSAKRDKPLVIYGDGKQTRDFVNVSDIVEAIIACAKTGAALGQVFNVGSGKPTCIGDLANAVLELVGVQPGIHHEQPRGGDILNSYADISKAGRLLGYEPKVSLHDGLRALINESAA